MLRRLVNDAMRSDPRAVKLLLSLVVDTQNRLRPRFVSATCWLKIKRSSRNICKSLPASAKRPTGSPMARSVVMTSEARLLEALLRNDFRAFVRKVFATLSPGQTYVRTWHVEAIAWQFERVRRGEIRRLIINMPRGR